MKKQSVFYPRKVIAFFIFLVFLSTSVGVNPSSKNFPDVSPDALRAVSGAESAAQPGLEESLKESAGLSRSGWSLNWLAGITFALTAALDWGEPVAAQQAQPSPFVATLDNFPSGPEYSRSSETLNRYLKTLVPELPGPVILTPGATVRIIAIHETKDQTGEIDGAYVTLTPSKETIVVRAGDNRWLVPAGVSLKVHIDRRKKETRVYRESEVTRLAVELSDIAGLSDLMDRFDVEGPVVGATRFKSSGKLVMGGIIYRDGGVRHWNIVPIDPGSSVTVIAPDGTESTVPALKPLRLIIQDGQARIDPKQQYSSVRKPAFLPPAVTGRFDAVPVVENPSPIVRSSRAAQPVPAASVRRFIPPKLDPELPKIPELQLVAAIPSSVTARPAADSQFTDSRKKEPAPMPMPADLPRTAPVIAADRVRVRQNPRNPDLSPNVGRNDSGPGPSSPDIAVKDRTPVPPAEASPVALAPIAAGEAPVRRVAPVPPVDLPVPPPSVVAGGNSLVRLDRLPREPAVSPVPARSIPESELFSESLNFADRSPVIDAPQPHPKLAEPPVGVVNTTRRRAPASKPAEELISPVPLSEPLSAESTVELRKIEGDILNSMARLHQWAVDALNNHAARVAEQRQKKAGTPADRNIADFNTLKADVDAAMGRVILVLRDYVRADGPARAGFWNRYQQAVQNWFDARERQVGAYLELADDLLQRDRQSASNQGNTSTRDLERSQAASEIAGFTLLELTAFRNLYDDLIELGVPVPFLNAAMPDEIGYTPYSVPVIPSLQKPAAAADRARFLEKAFNQIAEILRLNSQKLGVDIRLRLSEYQRFKNNFYSTPRGGTLPQGTSREEMNYASFLRDEAIFQRAQQQRLSAQINFVEALQVLSQTQGQPFLPADNEQVRAVVANYAVEHGYPPDIGQEVVISVVGLRTVRDTIFISAQERLSRAISDEMAARVVLSQKLIVYLQDDFKRMVHANLRVPGAYPAWDIFVAEYKLRQARQQLAITQLAQENDTVRAQLGLPRSNIELAVPPAVRSILETNRQSLLPGSSITESTDSFKEWIKGADASVLSPLDTAENLAATFLGLVNPPSEPKADDLVRRQAENERKMLEAKIKMLENENWLAKALASIRESTEATHPGSVTKPELEDARNWRAQIELRNAEIAVIRADIVRLEPGLDPVRYAELRGEYNRLVLERLRVASRVNRERMDVLDGRLKIEGILELNAEAWRRFDAAYAAGTPQPLNQILGQLRNAGAVRRTDSIDRAIQSWGQTNDYGKLLEQALARNEELVQRGASLDAHSSRPALPTLETVLFDNSSKSQTYPDNRSEVFTVTLGKGGVPQPLQIAGPFRMDALVIPSYVSPRVEPYQNAHDDLRPRDWQAPRDSLEKVDLLDSTAPTASGRFGAGSFFRYRQTPALSSENTTGLSTFLRPGVLRVDPRVASMPVPGVRASWDPNKKQWTLPDKAEDRQVVYFYPVRKLDIVFENGKWVPRVNLFGIVPQPVSWREAGQLAETPQRTLGPNRSVSRVGEYVTDPLTGDPYVSFNVEGGFSRYRINVTSYQTPEGKVEQEFSFISETIGDTDAPRSAIIGTAAAASGQEESIVLPAGATNGNIIIFTPETVEAGVELMLNRFRLAAGEKIPVAVIVSDAVQHSHVLDLLEGQPVELLFPIMDLSVTGDSLKEAIDALAADAESYSLKPLVIDTMAAFRQLGTFLGIPELDQRLLNEWLDQQGVVSQA